VLFHPLAKARNLAFLKAGNAINFARLFTIDYFRRGGD
jgi:hypothetical protein